MLRAKKRENTTLIYNEMKKRDFVMEILQNIKDKEQEINNFTNKRKMVRAESEVLNKISTEEEEINRKEEIKKGNC